MKLVCFLFVFLFATGYCQLNLLNEIQSAVTQLKFLGDQLLVGRADATWQLLDGLVGPLQGILNPLLSILTGGLIDSGLSLEMVTPLGSSMFALSNDESSLTIVGAGLLSGSAINVNFDPALGMAVSGTMLGSDLLVTGHRNGFMAVWDVNPGILGLLSSVSLLDAFNISSLDPIRSLRGQRAIQALEALSPNLVLTGSADGDLAIVRVPSGEVVFRTRYSAQGTSGINHLSVSGNMALVSTRARQAGDSNLHMFRVVLNPPRLRLLDSADLLVNAARDGVNNLNTELVRLQNGLRMFFAGTSEGVLWIGRINGTMLVPIRFERMAAQGITPIIESIIEDARAFLAVAASDSIKLFEIVGLD